MKNPRYVMRINDEGQWQIIDLTTEQPQGRAYTAEEIYACYREAVSLNAVEGYI